MRDEKDQSQVQEQIDYLKKKYQAGIELLLTPMMDVSSSDIRQMVQYGMDISSLVPLESKSIFMSTDCILRRKRESERKCKHSCN